jgi:metal-dependent amidase/aminoacylase/carboxypeptidase family protein
VYLIIERSPHALRISWHTGMHGCGHSLYKAGGLAYVGRVLAYPLHGSR